MKKSSKQALLQLVKDQINEYTEIKDLNKEIIASFWERAEPNSVEGIFNFQRLNRSKNIQREVNLKLKKLAALAKELKG